MKYAYTKNEIPIKRHNETTWILIYVSESSAWIRTRKTNTIHIDILLKNPCAITVQLKGLMVYHQKVQCFVICLFCHGHTKKVYLSGHAPSFASSTTRPTTSRNYVGKTQPYRSLKNELVKRDEREQVFRCLFTEPV